MASFKEGLMERRKFLKQISLWSAGALAGIPVLNLTGTLHAAQDDHPSIFVATGKAYEQMVQDLVERCGGMAVFVKPGVKVVVKPNIGWDRTVAQAANTHPDVVKTVVKLALDAGASRVKVFDRTCNDRRRCYASSGIKEAVQSLKHSKVRCEYIDDRKFIPVHIKNGKNIQKWEFYKDALEADTYINVPVAKHHGFSRLSLGLKNIMGVIGGMRGRLHFNLAQNLADLNQVIRPDLTIVDATRVLTRNGPQGGNLADVKTFDIIIAATDPVAADAFATTLFGLDPSRIDSTVAAYETGLGQMDLDKCRIQTV